MSEKQKREAHFLVNLTEKEAEKIITLARKERRKPSEWLYYLISDTLSTK
jgi:hypothetical protein